MPRLEAAFYVRKHIRYQARPTHIEIQEHTRTGQSTQRMGIHKNPKPLKRFWELAIPNGQLFITRVPKITANANRAKPSRD